MVAEMTAMEVSGASLLDEATAAAEAMQMSHRILKGKRSKYFVDSNCHQQTIDVIQTRAEPMGIEVVVGDSLTADLSKGDYCGILVQYPDTRGADGDRGGRGRQPDGGSVQRRLLRDPCPVPRYARSRWGSRWSWATA